MDLFTLVAVALFGGAVAAVGVTWYANHQKTKKLRLLKSAAKSVTAVAEMSDEAEAAEAEKRAVDERRALEALQSAVSKL